MLCNLILTNLYWFSAVLYFSLHFFPYTWSSSSEKHVPDHFPTFTLPILKVDMNLIQIHLTFEISNHCNTVRSNVIVPMHFLRCWMIIWNILRSRLKFLLKNSYSQRGRKVTVIVLYFMFIFYFLMHDTLLCRYIKIWNW